MEDNIDKRCSLGGLEFCIVFGNWLFVDMCDRYVPVVLEEGKSSKFSCTAILFFVIVHISLLLI